MLLTILNDWPNGGESGEEENTQEEEFTDWYEILELDPDAAKADIKKRYRELMKKYHPDQNNGNSEYDEMVKKIIEANRILSDDKKRKEFDEKRKNYKG